MKRTANEVYFYVDSKMVVQASLDRSNELDLARFEVSNYFKTKESANKVASKFKEVLNE